jgi:Domain of unknown function (DUF4282)
MTERSSGQGQGRPGDWGNSGYGAAQPQYGAPQPQYGAPQPQYGAPETQVRSDPTADWGAAGRAAATSRTASRPTESKGFLASLFDFSFTSLITTRVVKFAYVLVTILLFLVALAYTYLAFKVNSGLGIGVLLIGDPLYIILGMMFTRLGLEYIIVFFRMAQDIKALRDRGEVR